MTTPEALLAEIVQEAQETARWTGRDSFDPRVLQVMRKVRREAFVPAEATASAYVNAPLHIGCGQTISQPFIVALMTDLLDLQPQDRVLEVGTGSGYQTAILAELAGEVFTIEVIPQLSHRAVQVLQAEGYPLVLARVGDGANGWPEYAPFDRIIVTAAAPEVPHALVEQLRPGGRLVIPVGKPYGEQELRLVKKAEDGHVTSRAVLAVAFVPLTRPSENEA